MQEHGGRYRTEWNKLMAWGDALEPTTTVPRDGANQDDDVAMQILDEPDEEDGEEIQIRTPPSAMPSTGSSTSTPARPEQVDTIFNTRPYLEYRYRYRLSGTVLKPKHSFQGYRRFWISGTGFSG